ncbi:MAG: hypothetical protein GY797_07935 [Deltaproteobacteria bacterium]|nr:hypothetical protein [Deltaproteobacteria bacterium]MCP5007165.1 hypothetical protein [Planctomycetota bacterium]
MHDEKKNGPCEVQDSYFERMIYYFGKLMTESDFRSEQKYMNEKRWLLNRLGIGWGVLCGLKVEVHETDKSKIIINPGFAIDDSGREIRLEKPVCKDLKDVVIPGDKRELYISIKYCEFPAKPVPIPKEVCGPSANECLHNSIYESFKIIVSFEKPETGPEKTSHIPGCEDDCVNLLDGPCLDSLKECHKPESCKPIPLAKVSFGLDDCSNIVVTKPPDNCDGRKLAFSNEKLYEMIRCLKQELWKAHAAKYDRKQYVPLLAQTIRGVEYRDGRMKEISCVGIHPKRLTTDGKYIWITDCESNEIIRIDKDFIYREDKLSLEKVQPLKINLGCKSWGIAFDGQNMWVAHPDTNQVTRINVCDVDDRETITDEIPPYPQEILYDGKDIWVSHGWPKGGQPDGVFQLTRIDTSDTSSVNTYTITSSTCKPNTPIVSMIWDGSGICVAFQTADTSPYYGSKVAVMKIENPVDAGNDNKFRAILTTKGKMPEDIVFDGTHIWVTHNDGATKVDVEGYKEVSSLTGESKQTAVVFDGSDIWTSEKGDDEAKVNRLDIFGVNITGSLEIMSSGEKTTYKINKICFDGTYLWVAAYKEEEGKQKTGIIHRLLP